MICKKVIKDKKHRKTIRDEKISLKAKLIVSHILIATIPILIIVVILTSQALRPIYL